MNSGAARAAVFGVSDGVTSNLALVAGVAASGVAPSVVLTAGVAGMLAGAFSMASGEWVSMRAHSDLVAAELAKERRELERNFDGEHQELTGLLAARGVRPEAAADVASELMVNTDVALVSHAYEELGVDPTDHGAPVRAATSSFAAFTAGALVPLVPWLWLVGTSALWASMIAGLLCAVTVGTVVGRLSHQRPVAAVARQVAAMLVATGLTVAVGSAFSTVV